MRVIIQSNYQKMSQWAANHVIERINEFNPTPDHKFVLGLPTGSSPVGMYNALVEANRAGTSIMMVTHSEKVASCSERVIYLVDGNIQGELTLGKMESDDDMPVRERKLRNWLLFQD